MAKKGKKEQGIKIIRELAPKIKEIKEEAEANENELEQEVEEQSDKTFQQFLAGKPAFNIPEVRSESIEQEAPSEVSAAGAAAGTVTREEELASQREQYQKTELGEERSRYQPQVSPAAAVERPTTLMPAPEGMRRPQQFESPELARMRHGGRAAREERYEIKQIEEKKETRRKYPWEA